MYHLCKSGLLHDLSTGNFLYSCAAASDLITLQDSLAELCVLHCCLMKQTDCKAFSDIYGLTSHLDSV